jgi:hypothetical protein
VIVLNDKLIQEVNLYIEDNHQTFSKLGKRFFDIFGYDNNRIRAQIRNLENITCSATRFTDIEDFVKNQMGKEKIDERKWKKLGGEVLQQLKQLREKSQELDDNPYNQMDLRLRLARGWVRAVVSEYLYQVASDQMGEDS